MLNLTRLLNQISGPPLHGLSTYSIISSILLWLQYALAKPLKNRTSERKTPLQSDYEAIINTIMHFSSPMHSMRSLGRGEVGTKQTFV